MNINLQPFIKIRLKNKHKLNGYGYWIDTSAVPRMSAISLRELCFHIGSCSSMQINQQQCNAKRKRWWKETHLSAETTESFVRKRDKVFNASANRSFLHRLLCTSFSWKTLNTHNTPNINQRKEQTPKIYA